MYVYIYKDKKQSWIPTGRTGEGGLWRRFPPLDTAPTLPVRQYPWVLWNPPRVWRQQFIHLVSCRFNHRLHLWGDV